MGLAAEGVRPRGIGGRRGGGCGRRVGGRCVGRVCGVGSEVFFCWVLGLRVGEWGVGVCRRGDARVCLFGWRGFYLVF